MSSLRRAGLLAALVLAVISGAFSAAAVESLDPLPYTITVVDDETGLPVKGVEAALFAWDAEASRWSRVATLDTTDADGVMSGEIVNDEETYGVIRFSDPRHRFEPSYGEAGQNLPDGPSGPGVYHYDGVSTMPIEFTTRLQPKPAATSVIRGRIVDENGRGRDDVQVQAFRDGDHDPGRPAATSLTYASAKGWGHGYFELWVPAGDYELQVTDIFGDGRYTSARWGTYHVEENDVYTVDENLALQVKASVIVGKVLRPNGRGLDGIKVEAWADDDSTEPVASAITYASRGGFGSGHGYYELWMPDFGGKYRIRFSDLEGTFGAQVYRNGGLVRAKHGVVRLDPVRMSVAGTMSSITGKVESPDGEPVEGAHVRLYRAGADGVSSTSARRYSGEDGRFTFASRMNDRTYTACASFGDEESCLGGSDAPDEAHTFTVPAGASSFVIDEPIVITPPCRGRVISNGTISLGVNCTGELNVDADGPEAGTSPGVGVQYDATGNDATYPGCTCEGWGVGDATSEIAGWANTSSGDSDNLELLDFEADDDSATSTVQVGDTYVITHDYQPAAETDNAYAVTVTVRNISDAPTDLRYRRVMDWDVEPTAFDEYVTMQTGDAEELVYTSDDGFATSDPRDGPSSIDEEGDWVDSGPNDHGALFDFAFGTLAPGESRTFQTYYGAAGDESGAMDALASIGAEAYSLGQPMDDGTEATAGNPVSGTPNTFMFAFSGVGGSAVTPPIAHADTFTVARNGGPTTLLVLDNDSDPEGDPVRVFSASDPAHGSVECSRLSCAYTPDADFEGEDAFDYTITDGRGGFATATVAVHVTSDVAGENTSLPSFVPDPRVGTLLTALRGTWSPTSGLAFSYVWKRDGVVIDSVDATDGNATYTPVRADLGTDLSVAVTASRTSGPAVADVTAESAAVEVGPGAPAVNTVAPSIPTPVTFDRLVTARPGTWAPTPARFAYQWLRDGAPIAGATSAGYVPGADDVGTDLTVAVTAKTPGHEDATVESDSVEVVPGAAPRNLALPAISGVAANGRTLTASAGGWNEPTYLLDFDYQWLVDGSPVAGADGASFHVNDLPVGAQIAVRVTAKLDGHADGTATSLPVVVGAVAGSNTAPPSISGTVKVLETLTVNPGTWTGSDLTRSHAWYGTYGWDSSYRFLLQEGGATFTVPSWMAGYRIVVEETVTGAPGTAPVTASSALSGPVADVPPLYADGATFDATPRAGAAVGVRDVAWYTWTGAGRENVPGVGTSVDWYVDWNLVAEDQDTFTPTAAMGGKTLYAVVHGEKAGYQPGAAYVSSQRIRRLGEAEGTLNLTVKRAEAPFTAVPNASVSVCEVDGWECTSGTTNGTGKLSLALTGTPAGVNYRVQVYAPYDTSLFDAAATASVVAGATRELTVGLRAPMPIPPTADLSNTIGERSVDTDGDGTTDGAYPVVVVGQSSVLEVTGCADVEDPTWTVTFASGATPMTGSLTRGAVTGDLATYSATLPGYTSTGKATVSTNVPLDCTTDQPTEFSLYIDPSGVVTDQFGRIIPGATVTLLREVGGTYVPVTDKDAAVMDPAINDNNPSVTNSDGFFRWDVVAGSYKVSVTSASSGGASCDVATTNPLVVPPPRLDLLVKVSCPGSTAPTPTAAPELSGTPQVGQVLTVSRGVWGDGLVYDRTEWLRDGVVVGTGTSYTLTVADQAKQITARVSARRPDYVQENGTGGIVTFTPATYDRVSAEVAAAPGGGGGGGGTATAPVNTVAPSVTGVAKVGRTLTANPGTWNTAGLTFGYQWLRDGAAIVGATSSDYTPVAADLGKALSVKVTVSKTGIPDGMASSAPVTVALGDAPQALSPPIVTGEPEAGGTLSVDTGRWDLAGLSFSYQWLRDGEPIAGQTGSSYDVTEADEGHGIGAAVTATTDGYAQGRANAAEVLVPEGPEDPEKVTSTTTADLKRETVKAGKRARLVVTVARSDGEDATGPVRVWIDGARAVTVRLRGGDDGRVVVELPKRKPGVHKIQARYIGGQNVAPSRSGVVKLKVVKKGKRHRVAVPVLRLPAIF